MDDLSLTFVSTKSRFSPPSAIDRLEVDFTRDIARYLKSLPRILFAEPETVDGWEERLDATTQTLRDTLVRYMSDAAEIGVDEAADWVERNILGTKSAVKNVEIDWDLPHLRAYQWALNYAAQLVTRVTNTTKQAIAREVAEFAISEEGVLTLARRLRQKFPFSEQRSRLIAVTETTRSFAEGSREGFKESNLVDGMQWVTANDERVCPICAPLGGLKYGEDGADPTSRQNQEARGVVTDLDSRFVHPGGPGAAARFEGRAFDVPAHPGCRCYLAPVISDFQDRQQDLGLRSVSASFVNVSEDGGEIFSYTGGYSDHDEH